MNLEGLLLEDEANFGEVEGDATVLNFGASSRISGCLNFVLNADDGLNWGPVKQVRTS